MTRQAIYLGVDQTGAVNSRGIPRALPVCALLGDELKFFYLASLTRKHIESELGTDQLSDLSIAIDCVLGLPEVLGVCWRQAVQSTASTLSYGRAPAQNFFQTLGQGRIPRRRVEILCGAHSVFQERPFQRNIQTGTFRIWKDLNGDSTSFYASAVEEQKHERQIPVFEGYPSLSWKLLLNARHRRPEELDSLLKAHFPELVWTANHQRQVEHDRNLADALLLALSMRQFGDEARTMPCSPEGWILGVSTSLSSK